MHLTCVKLIPKEVNTCAKFGSDWELALPDFVTRLGNRFAMLSMV